MRRPRMSTGAWVFTGLICAAVIAPAGVYAASVSRTVLVSPGGTTSARVTDQHQLLTAQIPLTQMVRATTSTQTNTFCKAVYTPPAHKAIVVTAVTYTFGSGTAGVENYGGLFDTGCDNIVDQVDGVAAYDTVQHTFPTGLPMKGVAVNSSGGAISVFVSGYLVDSSALPASASSRQSGDVKAMTARGGRH